MSMPTQPTMPFDMEGFQIGMQLLQSQNNETPTPFRPEEPLSRQMYAVQIALARWWWFGGGLKTAFKLAPMFLPYPPEAPARKH